MGTIGFRRVIAGILLVSGILASEGCRRRSHSTTVLRFRDDDLFTTDDFPGGPVQDGNVADDRRAMSEAGTSAIGAQCVFNGDRGTAILVTETKGSSPTDPAFYYAQYFDGGIWTPPVVLTAPDVNWTTELGDVHVAFVNTSSHPSESARERDGDAIIFWTAEDLDDDGAALADGPNDCLFATYFDVTHAAEPDRRFGFQLLATRLTSLEGKGEDVVMSGVVSDSLCGETAYPDTKYAYGQETTGIVAFWLQKEDNDATLAGTEDTADWYTWFDVAAAGDPELPLVPTAAVRLPVIGYGARDSGFASEETQVGANQRVYNNVLFIRVASRYFDGTQAAGFHLPASGMDVPYGSSMNTMDDVTLQYFAFDLATGTFTGPTSLSSGMIDSTDTDESNMEFLYLPDPFPPAESIYGSDEGLAELVIFCLELSDDPDAVADFGTVLLDGELRISAIDESTGALLSGAPVSVGDPTIFDTVQRGRVSTRISRNGDYIWIGWTQPDAAGTTDDRSVRVAQFLTTRPEEDGTFVLQPVASALSLPQTLNTDIDGFSPAWIAFQDGLGYICGAQSDPDVMNLFFEHSGGFDDQVFQARLVASHDAPPTPAATVTPFESFGNNQMAGPPVNDIHQNFDAIDSGEGGNVLAVFRQDLIPALGVDDYRLFARRTGLGAGKVEIGSASSVRQAANPEIRLIATPPAERIGTLDPVTMEGSDDRAHAAEIVHVIFAEDRFNHMSGDGPALRTRVFDTRDTGLPVGEAFQPSAGTAFELPFDLDLPGVDPDPVDAPFIVGTAVDGNSVGLWFGEEAHLYYQEFNEEDGWRVRDGVGDPALIDDDGSFGVTGMGTFFATRSCTCETLHGAMVFWRKELDPGSGDLRLQVRVRE